MLQCVAIYLLSKSYDIEKKKILTTNLYILGVEADNFFI